MGTRKIILIVALTLLSVKALAGSNCSEIFHVDSSIYLELESFQELVLKMSPGHEKKAAVLELRVQISEFEKQFGVHPFRYQEGIRRTVADMNSVELAASQNFKPFNPHKLKKIVGTADPVFAKAKTLFPWPQQAEHTLLNQNSPRKYGLEWSKDETRLTVWTEEEGVQFRLPDLELTGRMDLPTQSGEDPRNRILISQNSRWKFQAQKLSGDVEIHDEAREGKSYIVSHRLHKSVELPKRFQLLPAPTRDKVLLRETDLNGNILEGTWVIRYDDLEKTAHKDSFDHWSPDGRWLHQESRGADGVYSYKILEDGGAEMTQLFSMDQLQFLPGMPIVLIQATYGNREWMLVELGDSEGRVLKRLEYRLAGLSPSGKYLVTVDRDGQFGLWTTP